MAQELAKDVAKWFDQAIARLERLKKETLKVLEKEGGIARLNRLKALREKDPTKNPPLEHTEEIIRMILNVREARQKRKKELKELMTDIKKKRKGREEARLVRKKEAQRLMAGFTKEREEAAREWQKLLETMEDKRKD